MSKPAKTSLQTWMAAALQQPTSFVDDEAISAAASQHITGSAQLSPVEQLDIYREQFFLRHVDALAEDYPGVRFFVGEERFHALALAYLAHHPPTSFTLRDLGDSFPRFLRETRRDETVDVATYEHACDMADVEWAFVEVFDAADAAPLAPAVLAQVPPEEWPGAKLVLLPSLRLLALACPVHRMREALLEGETPEIPAAEPVRLALFREELQLRYAEIDEDLFALAGELLSGTPLGPACDAVAARFSPDDPAAFAPRLQATFARLTQFGWLVAVEVGGGRPPAA